MAQAKTRSRKLTNTKAQKTNKQSKAFIRGNGQSFIATFMGIAIGVPLAVAAMTPVIKAEIASDNSSLTRAVQVAPAAALLQCAQPTASSLAATVKPGIAQPVGSPSASLFTQPVNNLGTPVSKKVIGNLFANNTATISDTGPNSTNKVDINNTDTTTITNDNNINLSNSNSQTSQSGQTSVNDNTTAGSASTGSASNSNSSSYDISIDN